MFVICNHVRIWKAHLVSLASPSGLSLAGLTLPPSTQVRVAFLSLDRSLTPVSALILASLPHAHTQEVLSCSTIPGSVKAGR